VVLATLVIELVEGLLCESRAGLEKNWMKALVADKGMLVDALGGVLNAVALAFPF
jgi:hypothetical protein